MNILYLRSNYGIPDSRAEKEIYALSKKHNILFFGWDRENKYRKTKTVSVQILDKSFSFTHIGIKAGSGGVKKMFVPLLRFWKAEYRFLKENLLNYDAVHVCDFDTALPLLFLRKKIPIVYDIYDYYADTHSAPRVVDGLLRKLESKVIRKSDVVIICNEIRKKQILPESPRNLVVIHNSPSINLIRDVKINAAISSFKVKLVYVGALITNRFLVEMSDVISKRKDVELHIGGIGVLEKYFLDLSSKASNIHFYGKMNYQDVLSLEKQCDIMTAIYDASIKNNQYASPNKFYEALMLKKPLIMMRDTGMDSYVEKYQLGEVIDGSAETFKEGFSRALDNLIAKKEQWAEMGERGYKLYQEQFSWDEMEKRLLKLYDELESTINKD